MFNFGIRKQLMFMLLAGSIIPVLCVGLLTFNYSKKAMQESAFNHLLSIREIKRQQLTDFFKNKASGVSILAEAKNTKELFQELLKYHNSGGLDTDGSYIVSTERYKALYAKVDTFMRAFAENGHYQDLTFLCAAHGHVMYSSAQNSDLGTSLANGPYQDSGHAKVWAKAIQGKRVVWQDFSLYGPHGVPTMFVAAPMFGDGGELLAVISAQIGLAEINNIMHERTGMGKTGETYLMGEDLIMRCDSFFESHGALTKKIDNQSTRQITSRDQGGQGVILDYRGIEVLSSYTHVGLNEKLNSDFEWFILAEIDSAEAFAPVYDLSRKIIWGAVIVTLLSIIAGLVMTGKIVNPLFKLATIFAKVSEGDLTVNVETDNRSDEIGSLMKSSQVMLTTMREQNREINAGVLTLSTTIAKLSSTASQLAASAAETSVTISEVGVTIDEVRHAAELNNDETGLINKEAQTAGRIAEDGKNASRESTEGMKLINEEMKQLAVNIVRLSDQTQNIGEITASVNDLADQSNLLSVNASIEAAKAGEYGVGFTVVALEVKSLAEQSKEASGQIKAILNEIQKATSAAVLSTERGNEVVSSGLDLNAKSSETIDRLATSVVEFEESSLQIGTSSRHQLDGMEQLVVAITSIKDATSQNVDGAKQLENATRNLDVLCEKLNELTNMFKV